MGYDEAVSLGNNFCRSRGYDCRLKEAHSAEGGDKWKVKFAAFAPGARGHLHLEYNAYSRALLKVDEKVKDRGNGNGRGRGRGHGKHDRDDDDEWDD
jgi:hypothetical protein